MDGNCTECVVGVLYKGYGAELATVPDLMLSIKDTQEFNASCRFHGYNNLVHKEYTLKDYADRRKSTNLTRFAYCPMCGKKIDWKKIGRANDAK